MDHVSRMYMKWLYNSMPWNNRFFRQPKYQKRSGFLAKEPLVLKMHLQAMFADMPDNFHLHSPLLNHRWEITKWAISITNMFSWKHGTNGVAGWPQHCLKSTYTTRLLLPAANRGNHYQLWGGEMFMPNEIEMLVHAGP